MFSKVKKFRPKHAAKYALKIGVPIIIGISGFGLVLYAQPLPKQTSHPVKTTHSQTMRQPAATQPKPTQPAVAAPPATPVAGPPPAPTKTVPQAGTPKAEPVVTPSPSSNVSGLAPTTPAPTPSAPQAPSSQTTTGYTSTNWSGYLATNGSFTTISGAWTATLATGNGSTQSADSTWIGIGGVTSGDLIQTGTENIISASGQVSTSAFFELLPGFAQPIASMPVTAGDSMSAAITQVTAGQWTISITDVSTGQTFTTSVSYASSLSSAEWIEEDPSYSFRQQIPFDNFNLASFTAGMTTDNGLLVTIAASTAQPVTMVNNAGQPIAVPSAIGANGMSFTVTP